MSERELVDIVSETIPAEAKHIKAKLPHLLPKPLRQADSFDLILLFLAKQSAVSIAVIVALAPEQKAFLKNKIFIKLKKVLTEYENGGII